MYTNDKRIVMTLDAGGKDFVFSAIQGNVQIVDEILFPSEANNLEKSLSNIVEGFNGINKSLPDKPSAISFAFPGPADYPKGILGDVGNFPAYRGGIALGPMLKEVFGIPVFINNDGDLFAYGEAIAGFLPYINYKLKAAGNPRRYRNLLGLTLDTGFGSGIVHDGELFVGDNSMAGEICFFRNNIMQNECVEEYASIRGIRRIYAETAGMDSGQAPSPHEIFLIGIGMSGGNQSAAVETYKQMAKVVGDTASHCITMLDCLVVIGGELAGAGSLFMPFLFEEMNSGYVASDGTLKKRLLASIYNLDDEEELLEFTKNDSKEITIHGSTKKISYDPIKKIGVGLSRIGTSKAISIGAYTFALKELDKK